MTGIDGVTDGGIEGLPPERNNPLSTTFDAMARADLLK